MIQTNLMAIFSTVKQIDQGFPFPGDGRKADCSD